MKIASEIGKHHHWEFCWGAHRVDSGIVFKIVLAWMLAVFSPYEPLISGAFILVFIDLLTGIWAAIKLPERFVATEFMHASIKSVGYSAALVAAIVAERMVPGWIPFSKGIGSLIAVAELFSILNNCNQMLGNSTFDAMLKRLGSKDQK